MENKESQDGLKELRAYKVGYDLGFFRGVEAMSDKVRKIAELIEMSATWKEIEREAKEKGDEKIPFLFHELLASVIDASTLKNELMPTLLVEKRAINDLGKRLQTLPPEAFTGDNLVLDFEKPAELEKGKGK